MILARLYILLYRLKDAAHHVLPVKLGRIVRVQQTQRAARAQLSIFFSFFIRLLEKLIEKAKADVPVRVADQVLPDVVVLR